MSKLTFTALALFLAIHSSAQAELVPSQPLSVATTDVSNLAGEMLDRVNSSNPNGSSALQTPSASATRLANQLTTAKTNANTTKQEDPISIQVREMVSPKKPTAHAEQGMMERMTALASQTVRRFNQSGLASWYGRQFNGRPTASGERFDMHAMTAAHRSLPFNCYIRVTNQDNGKSVVVKVNDRGPFHGNRILDLSYAAAQQIGIMNKGVGNVTIERIDPPK